MKEITLCGHLGFLGCEPGVRYSCMKDQFCVWLYSLFPSIDDVC